MSAPASRRIAPYSIALAPRSAAGPLERTITAPASKTGLTGHCVARYEPRAHLREGSGTQFQA
jgi:hypothetical protein